MVVILCTLLRVAIGGGEIAVLPHGLLLPGIASVGDPLFAGVAEELFARGPVPDQRAARRLTDRPPSSLR